MITSAASHDRAFSATDTYNAAADCYDAEALSFWARYGQRTVDRIALRRGANVLDVCSGSGASALPAARVVGEEGRVTAVDVARELLRLGRLKAARSNLNNIEFRQQSMASLGYPDKHFDAIVCVFGIFFVADMAAQLAELWRMLRPGGKLAVTTWGEGLFAPASEVWWAAVDKRQPHLRRDSNAWDRVTTPGAVRALFADAGIAASEVRPEPGYQTLRSAADFWTIARGSGLRQTIEQLGNDLASDLRREVVETLENKEIRRIRTDVIYAIARKPY